MSTPDVDPERLRTLLEEATGQETIRRLMTVIPVAEGADPETVADRYGLAPATVTEWVGEFETDATGTFERLERFGKTGRRVTPTGGSSDSHLEYLDHAVLAERDWTLDDPDLFEKARSADIDEPRYGGFTVRGGESILEAAEREGLDWPHACRGGACSNCAVIVTRGEVSMPGDQILPDEALERGARLTCVGTPVSDRIEVVYNVATLDFLEEFRLQSRAAPP